MANKTKKKKLAVCQGDYKVGDKHPPKEYQFKPGESGNPKGPPKRRTQLWTYFCRYMNMTDTEIDKLDEKKLTQCQQFALKLIKNAKNGKYTGSERLARYAIDRDEGRAIENLSHIFPEGCGVMVVNGTSNPEQWKKQSKEYHRNFDGNTNTD